MTLPYLKDGNSNNIFNCDSFYLSSFRQEGVARAGKLILVSLSGMAKRVGAGIISFV